MEDQIEIVNMIKADELKKSEGKSAVQDSVNEGDVKFSTDLGQATFNLDELADEVLNEMKNEREEAKK
ncbi:MAG: hypothetical protein AAGC79_11340 [Pseudomonadota bacterium]